MEVLLYEPLLFFFSVTLSVLLHWKWLILCPVIFNSCVFVPFVLSFWGYQSDKLSFCATLVETILLHIWRISCSGKRFAGEKSPDSCCVSLFLKWLIKHGSDDESQQGRHRERESEMGVCDVFFSLPTVVFLFPAFTLVVTVLSSHQKAFRLLSKLLTSYPGFLVGKRFYCLWLPH